MHRLYVPVYAVTLLLSAFLLFLIQPMFGKMVLPLLGGSPSVWNTAMLFFQALLLAGYAYAHGTARYLNIKVQALIHLGLLVLFVAVLPIAIPEGWFPPPGKDPTFWQLGLMAFVVGGPFFVLSGSAPMLQHWFAHTKHKDSDNPYFLYAASNLGSVSALLIYPFFVEPALKISEQSMGWAYGYGGLIVMVLLSALLAWGHEAPTKKEAKKDPDPITWKRRGMWLLLAFIPSSLMLGVTTFVTTDLASAPLLWIVPLTLYVTTFIIAFARKPLISAEKTYYYQGLLFIMMLSFMAVMADLSKPIMILTHLLLFFFTALMCHHELATSKPHARHLTQFYLFMSLGGALGGFFNAIIAPNIFIVPFEYAIVLALGCFMRESLVPEKAFAACWPKFRDALKKREKGFMNGTGLTYVVLILLASLATLYFKDFGSLRFLLLVVFLTVLTIIMEKRWVFGFSALIILTLHPPGFFWGGSMFDEIIYRDRNFFGIVRVADAKEEGIRLLLHGTTIHGTQALAAEHKNLRLSYYSESSGITDAFAMANQSGDQKVAVLGLGIGVTACYQKDGRHFDFFEIDPAVVEVAENRRFFTYLSDCGSPYDIKLGDARIKMTDETDKHYDIIVVDVFSSDSIPVHLLTFEAFELYKGKLKDDGFIVINISNRYMDLKPVIASAADKLGMKAYNKLSDEGKIEGMPYHQADFVVMTNTSEQEAFLKSKDWNVITPNEEFRLWTDQYSNIVALFKFFQMPEQVPQE